MNFIATLQVDLETTPLGTRSRLTDELCGETVLQRTVNRIVCAKNIAATYVLSPADQVERCKKLLEGTSANIHAFHAEPPSWRRLVQAARKWSLDGWRGGLGGTTDFDEYTDCRLLAGLLENVRADAVISLPAAAPVIDPELIDKMIGHYIKNQEGSRLTFTQAPPGLAGIILNTEMVRELAEKNIPVGWVFTYKPDTPQKDLLFQPCALDLEPEVRYVTGRLIADTDRSMQRLADLLKDHHDPDRVTVGRWLHKNEHETIEPLPKEVEIELTTDDPYPDNILRPRGSRVQSRGPIDPLIVQNIVEELSRYDDSLVVLGGFGDPLLHPDLISILKRIATVSSDQQQKSIYGVCVRTTAVNLTDELIEAMITYRVDVLNVTLDAWSPQLYSQLQSPSNPSAADLHAVLKRLDHVAQMREQKKSVAPVVVTELTKSRDNVMELDDFHDGWLRKMGAVTISGYSHYAEQCEDRRVINMAPPTREGCRRIRSRCVVLADGRVTMCDQDFNGLQAIGQLGEQTLEQIWRGANFEKIRTAHRENQFNVNPLCAACDEWHRP